MWGIAGGGLLPVNLYQVGLTGRYLVVFTHYVLTSHTWYGSPAYVPGIQYQYKTYFLISVHNIFASVLLNERKENDGLKMITGIDLP